MLKLQYSIVQNTEIVLRHQKQLDLKQTLSYTVRCWLKERVTEMKLLEEKILTCGTVLPGNILKIDSFLNHQIDVSLARAMGEEFHRLFKDKEITRVLTVEASGISMACYTGEYFNVPVVFAKKGKHKNVGSDVYSSEVYSYTKGEPYNITVSKKYLNSDDKVLIIDDFLANGAAANGLIDIINQAGAELQGIGIAVEKGFQPGGAELRKKGIKVESLAIVDSMTDDSITFREQ